MRNRVLLAALATVIALVLSGCNAILEGFGDTDAEWCDCPTLEATVASIDWAGDGREPDRKLSEVGSTGPDDFPFTLRLFYEMSSSNDVENLHAYVVAAMSAAGFEPEDSSGGPGRNHMAEYHTAHWAMIVYSTPWYTAGDGAGETSISLFVDASDERAPEYLARLIDAFGTR